MERAACPWGTMPIQNWKLALNQFVIILGSERVIL